MDPAPAPDPSPTTASHFCINRWSGYPCPQSPAKHLHTQPSCAVYTYVQRYASFMPVRRKLRMHVYNRAFHRDNSGALFHGLCTGFPPYGAVVCVLHGSIQALVYS